MSVARITSSGLLVRMFRHSKKAGADIREIRNARQIDGDNTDESKEKKRNRRRKGKSQTRKASE